MTTILSIGAICLYIVMLIVGVKKFDLSSNVKTVIGTAEVVLTVVSFLLLGLLGILLGVVILVLSGLVISIRSAMEFETLCASISINGQFTAKKDASRFIRLLRKTHGSFAYIDYMGLGKIVLRLSERGRSPLEIKQMAPAVNMAAAAFTLDSDEVTDLMDAALRQSGRPASDAIHVTDEAVETAQKSPMTFSEALKAVAEA